MITVTFDALFLKDDKEESTAFVKRNKRKLKNSEPCDRIIIEKDFNNIFLDNAVVVLEESSEQILGYIDETSAAKLILLNAQNISGSIIKIKKDDVTIRITAESNQPNDVVCMIENDDYVNIVARFCPIWSNDFFEERPLTYKQFSYAIDLGIDPRGKSFFSISDAIDSVLDGDVERKEPFPIQKEYRPFVYKVMCNNMHASKEQLKEIRNLHGKLLRNLSYNEAEEAIGFLRAYKFKCPYCHRKTENFEVCFYCGSRLDGVSIPIILTEEDEIKANNKNAGCVISLLVFIFLIVCFIVWQSGH